jgi:4-amino-4-deoxy-L-arabinose transferase-like glycosyltransferase
MWLDMKWLMLEVNYVKPALLNWKLIVLLSVAFLLRLWNFDQFPEFRWDEWPGLIGLFFICGVHYLIPRMIAVVVGTLTVLVTFAITKAAFNDSIGYLSGLILAINPAHIIVSSHVGWNATMTPFFVTLSAYFLYLGITRKFFAYVSMLMLGLAFQSHPTAFIAVIGAWLFAFYKWKTWGKNYIGMAVAFGLGCIREIYANLITNFAVAEEDARYIFGHTSSRMAVNFEVYEDNLRLLLLNFFKMLTGMKCYSYETMLGKPYFYIYPIIFLLGVVLCFYKRNDGKTLLLTFLLSFFGFMPLFLGRIQRFPSPYGAHYIHFIVPLACIVIGFGLYQLCEHIRRLPKPKPIFRNLLVGLLLGLILIYPLWALNDIYQDAVRTNNTNKPVIEVLDFIAKLGDKVPICVDRKIPYGHTLAKYIKVSTSDAVEVLEVGSIDEVKHLSQKSLLFITCPKFVEKGSLVDEFIKNYPSATLVKIAYSNDGDPFYLIYEL